MDTQYPPTMQPLGTFYPNGHPPIMPPPPPDLIHHHLQTYSMENVGGYSPIEDPSRAMTSPQQGSQQRPRRRQQPGSEHIKHRRTRSGCYTCRQRRVKCDENRPICDRCRKGKRECTYPGSTSGTTKTSRRGSKSKPSSADGSSSASGDEFVEEDKRGLAIIHDDDDDADHEDTEPPLEVGDRRIFTDAAELPESKKSPSAESPKAQRSKRPQASRTTSKHSIHNSMSQNPRWSSLSSDVKKYLRYHKEHLSHHHYAFKYDGGDFLKTTFLEIAMNDQSQALLYAVVAFSAYHHTIAESNLRLSTFLHYYNKSIILLQQSLKTKRPTVTTLLTILQLATIEEFLGDWGNLLGHQRAAYQILIDLFTPQTIVQDETRRKIIAWYIRFDLFAGMMSGSETTLGREWFAACQEHYSQQARDRPEDLGARYEDFFATSRLLATDIALLFAAKGNDKITDDDFAAQTQTLLAKLTANGEMLQTAFTAPHNFIQHFPHPSDDDLTDYRRDPRFLYGGPLFTMNYVLIDFWAIDLMFKHSLAMAQGQQPTAEMTQIALKKCKMFEAIQHCDEGPPGAIIGCQASLGIACLFLPKDEKHTSWCRRKFALIEQSGYLYPPTLRKRMSATWNIDVSRWWLPPSSDDDYPEILRAIRDFIDYRSELPKDEMDAHVRDMSGIFSSMRVEGEDSSLEGSPPA